MSLSFHAEHLAWQQRVNQEQSRSSNFYKTHGNFFTSKTASTDKSPFPKIAQTDSETNYRSGNFSLAYAFGGTKRANNSNSYHGNKKSRAKTPNKNRYEKTNERRSDAHARKLEELIQIERTKRIRAEKQLRAN